MAGLAGRSLLRRRAVFSEAVAQGVHKIDDVGGTLGRLRPLDSVPRGLALDEFAQREFVLILEFSRVEVAGFAVEDVAG